MSKRLFILSAVLCLVCTAFADVLLIDSVRVDPPEFPVNKSIKAVFTARVYSDAQHVPESVRLLRLQWSGSELPVSRMWDDGTHGDQKAKDGTYSCTLKLKEKVIGLLSFRILVKYKGIRTPANSQAIFINVVGGT
jgi:hypothetical protein